MDTTGVALSDKLAKLSQLRFGFAILYARAADREREVGVAGGGRGTDAPRVAHRARR